MMLWYPVHERGKNKQNVRPEKVTEARKLEGIAKNLNPFTKSHPLCGPESVYRFSFPSLVLSFLHKESQLCASRTNPNFV